MDTLTGDILTSYARVLAEWDGLVQIALYSNGHGGEGTLSWSPPPTSLSGLLLSYAGNMTLVTVLAPLSRYPYFCRMRQCWADFYSTHRWRPFFNALKYATAFPMLLLSLVAPRRSPSWILASLSNALYSAVWDLYVDWELHGGRKYYLFPRWTYVSAVILNASLRFTWILPLLESPQIGPTANGYFALQLLEIVRRFVWFLFRVESQQVQGQFMGTLAITSSDGLIPLDDIKMLSP